MQASLFLAVLIGCASCGDSDLAKSRVVDRRDVDAGNDAAPGRPPRPTPDAVMVTAADAPDGGDGVDASRIKQPPGDAGLGADGEIVTVDCRWPDAPIAIDRDHRWIAFRGKKDVETTSSAYVVNVSSTGFGTPYALSRVSSAWDIGSWSADGRFFAYEGEVDPGPIAQGTYIAEVDRVPAPVVTTVHATGTFSGWAPVGTLFAVRIEQNTLWIKDAAHIADPQRALGLGQILFYESRWSPDGRYFCLNSTETSADAGLYLVDTTAVNLSLLRLTTQRTTYPKWSLDGKYMAYARWTGTSSTLYWVDMSDPSFTEHSLGGPVAAIGSVADNFAWFDNRYIWWFETGSKALHFADMSSSPPTVSKIDDSFDELTISPGGKCLAFPCGDAAAPGTCIRTFPPTASSAPIRIYDHSYGVQWSSDGSVLSLRPYGSTGVRVIRTDGTSGTPIDVIRGTGIARIDANVQWSPTHPPQWFLYVANDTMYGDYTLRFWNVGASTTTKLDTGNQLQYLGDFSPDGRFYVFFPSLGTQPWGQLGLLTATSTTIGAPVMLAGVQALNTETPIFDLAWQP